VQPGEPVRDQQDRQGGPGHQHPPRQGHLARTAGVRVAHATHFITRQVIGPSRRPSEPGRRALAPELGRKTVVAIASSDAHILAVTSDGKVTGWGSDVEGSTTAPERLDGQVVTAVAAGGGHSLAVGTDFRAESRPAITGDAAVGGAVTATPGTYTATPATVAYQWYADGAPIVGATAATYRPAGAQVGKRLSAQVTATLPGHAAVVTTSDSVGPVSASTAPTLRLDAAQARVRRGQAVTLSWSSTGATTVTASGGWSGTRAASGTARVVPTAIGTTTYSLTATSAAGTTTARVQVTVTRPAARLKITTPGGPHRAGTR